jgi:hypothetical protein
MKKESTNLNEEKRLCQPRTVSGFTEWSRGHACDIDGQPIWARERERTSQTPYNVEPALMKGRGGTPVPPARAAFDAQERRSRSDTPYQTPDRL